MHDSTDIYIITSTFSRLPYFNSDYIIKIFDLKGNEIKEIKNFNNEIILVDGYYDKRLNKKYIIIGTNNSIKSYDFNNNSIYISYFDNDHFNHLNIIIDDKEEIVKLIESSEIGFIRIWNFHFGQLLKKIKVVDSYNLYGLCLWNDEYLLVGCSNNIIKLIDLKKGIIIKDINGHNSTVITIKKIIHPKHGECLISKDFYDNIKFWVNKK